MNTCISALGMPGCYLIKRNVFTDHRGQFSKIVSSEVLHGNGLEFTSIEQFYNVSRRGVIRGMHFQTPPMDHTKLVACIQGEVLDVLLDLRVGSPTYKTCICLHLSESSGEVVYIPSGIAHGFCSLSDDTIVCYNTSSSYSRDHDSGILWSSIGIEWPRIEPIVSERDESHPILSDFSSPFKYIAS